MKVILSRNKNCLIEIKPSLSLLFTSIVSYSDQTKLLLQKRKEKICPTWSNRLHLSFERRLDSHGHIKKSCKRQKNPSSCVILSEPWCLDHSAFCEELPAAMVMDEAWQTVREATDHLKATVVAPKEASIDVATASFIWTGEYFLTDRRKKAFLGSKHVFTFFPTDFGVVRINSWLHW